MTSPAAPLKEEIDQDIELVEFQKKFQPDRKLERRVIPIGKQKQKGGKVFRLEAVDVDDYLTEVDEDEPTASVDGKPLFRISRHDIVLVAGEDNGAIPYPFVAYVRDIYLDTEAEDSEEDDNDFPPNSGVMLAVNWLYRREELYAEAPQMHVELLSLNQFPKADFSGTKEGGILNEVFFSSSTAEIHVETVMHRCVVHFLRPDDGLPIRIIHRGKDSLKLLLPGFVCRQFYYQSGDKMFYLDEDLPEDAEEYQQDLAILLARSGEAMDVAQKKPDQVLPSPSASPSHLDRTLASPSLDSAVGPTPATSPTSAPAVTTTELTGKKRRKRPPPEGTIGTKVPRAISPEPPQDTSPPAAKVEGEEPSGDAGGAVSGEAAHSPAEEAVHSPAHPPAEEAVHPPAHPPAEEAVHPPAHPPASVDLPPVPKGIRKRSNSRESGVTYYYEIYTKIAGESYSQYVGQTKSLEEAISTQQRFMAMTVPEALAILEAKGIGTAKLRAHVGLPAL